MKTKKTKLTLNHETLRTLQSDQLGEVVGGKLFKREILGGFGTLSQSCDGKCIWPGAISGG